MSARQPVTCFQPKDCFEIKEGEASIFKPDDSGKAVLVIRLQADDLIKLSSM